MNNDAPSLLLPQLAEILKLRPDLTCIVGATGKSMIPTIVRGDRIHIKRPALTPSVGDIAVVRVRTGLFCIHRIRSVSPFIVTKGDASEIEDPPVDEIIGIVDHIERTWRSQLRRFFLKLRGAF
jgi:signal peptidase I